MATGVPHTSIERQFLAETIRKTKYAAKNTRNLAFTIDLEYVISLLEKQQGKCAITGWEMEFTRGGNFKGSMNPRGCTMDRIDNNKGYVPGNIQLTCAMPNMIRSTMSLKEFVSFCDDVSATFKLKAGA